MYFIHEIFFFFKKNNFIAVLNNQYNELFLPCKQEKKNLIRRKFSITSVCIQP